MTIILGILIITLAVIVHEAGHFAAARLLKIPVREFSVGFGPALASRERGGVRYSLRLILLGGYVIPEKRAVERSPLWQQLLVYLAGPGANVALVITIVAAGMAVTLAGKVPAWQLPVKAVQGGCMFVGAVTSYVIGYIQGGGALSLTGPVGIVAWLDGAMGSLDGVAALVVPPAIINMAIACTNLLPVPALDGGRALMALLRVPPAWQERAAAGSVALLLGLAALVTYADIMRLLR